MLLAQRKLTQMRGVINKHLRRNNFFQKLGIHIFNARNIWEIINFDHNL